MPRTTIWPKPVEELRLYSRQEDFKVFVQTDWNLLNNYRGGPYKRPFLASFVTVLDVGWSKLLTTHTPPTTHRGWRTSNKHKSSTLSRGWKRRYCNLVSIDLMTCASFASSVYWMKREIGAYCFQNFNLPNWGRYIVGYTVGNLVLRRRASVISDRISDDIPPQTKILIMAIPPLILMYFCSPKEMWRN